MGAFDDPPPGEAPDEPELDDGQLSLFSAISAVPLDEHGPAAGRSGRIGEVIPDLVRRSSGASPASRRGRRPPEPEPFVLAPAGGARRCPRSQPIAALELRPKSALARRRELRELNSEIVRELTHTLRRPTPR